jgi:hypothetical protein
MPKYGTLDLTHLQIYIHLAWKRLGTIANYCELIFLLSCNYKHRLTFSTVLSLRLRKEHYHIDMAPTVHLTDSGRDLEQQQAHANHSHANLHDSTSVHQHAVFWNIPCCLADTFTLHTLLSFTMHMEVSNPSGYPPNHPFVFLRGFCIRNQSAIGDPPQLRKTEAPELHDQSLLVRRHHAQALRCFAILQDTTVAPEITKWSKCDGCCFLEDGSSIRISASGFVFVWHCSRKSVLKREPRHSCTVVVLLHLGVWPADTHPPILGCWQHLRK